MRATGIISLPDPLLPEPVMIGRPEHPLAPAFDKAREWQAEQERQLTDPQRRAFDTLKEKQETARQRQKDGIDAVRKQLEERAKNRAPNARLNFNPPILIADPYTQRQARFVIAAEKRLEKLDRTHAEERTNTLKGFERQREHTPTKPEQDKTAAWTKALLKTAEQERGKDRDRDRSDEFDKGR